MMPFCFSHLYMVNIIFVEFCLQMTEKRAIFLLRIGTCKWVIGQRDPNWFEAWAWGQSVDAVWYEKAIILLIKGLDWIEPYLKLVHMCNVSSSRLHHPDIEILMDWNLHNFEFQILGETFLNCNILYNVCHVANRWEILMVWIKRVKNEDVAGCSNYMNYGRNFRFNQYISVYIYHIRMSLILLHQLIKSLAN